MTNARSRRRFKRSLITASAAATLLGLLASGCGDTTDADGGAAILPHQSPASFGELYPLGNRDPEPETTFRTPYEWVLLLQSNGDAPLKVDRVCLVGTKDDGSDIAPFTVEVENQELPATIDSGRDFGVRLTYDRQTPSEQADQVAIVVQSNATNYPTLIVPICARVIPDGEERGEVECEAPVSVAAGDSAADLCN